MPENPALSRCESCGAPVLERSPFCQHCGARVMVLVSDEELQRSTAVFLHAADEEFASGGVSLGSCLLTVVSITVAPYAAYVLLAPVMESHWGRVICAVFVALVGLAVDGQIVQHAEKAKFKRYMLPRMRKYIAEHELRKAEFLAVAHETLKKNSTLLRYMDWFFGEGA